MNVKTTKDTSITDVMKEAYAAELETVEKPQVITDADGSRAFLAPVVLGNPLCLQCHGTPGKDIAPETLAAIQKLYPDDKATGFQLGELRGLWRITFSASNP